MCRSVRSAPERALEELHVAGIGDPQRAWGLVGVGGARGRRLELRDRAVDGVGQPREERGAAGDALVGAGLRVAFERLLAGGDDGNRQRLLPDVRDERERVGLRDAPADQQRVDAAVFLEMAARVVARRW